MKTIFRKFFILAILLGTACDLSKDLADPNEVGLNGADPDLLLNGIQIDFADFYYYACTTATPLVRHQAMSRGFRYQTAFQPQVQDQTWISGYQALSNAEALITIAEPKNLTSHVAIAKITQAYIFLTMVDLFGDVPATEALKGTIFNPTVDAGTDVYDRALNLLAEAKTELAKTGSDAGAAVGRDIFYGGDRDLWTAMANTLELKAWINISTLPARAAEASGQIATYVNLASGAPLVELVDTPAEDFTYKYSATTVPDSRHPLYNQFYGPGEGQAGGYIGTSILVELYRGKYDPAAPTDPTVFTQDPRWRYMLYRQVGSIAAMNALEPKALGCVPGAPPNHYLTGGYTFCALDPGFFGRDHGNATGTPPDGPYITAVGVFPSGGKPDNNFADDAIPATDANHEPTIRGDGLDGAGILPIHMGFYTDFLVAEAMVRSGNTAGGRAKLIDAIVASVEAIKNFADERDQSVTIAPWTDAPWTPGPSVVNCNLAFPAGPARQACFWNNHVNLYTQVVGEKFDAAAGVNGKLAVVGTETWVATFGNGPEAYNSYRRTGGPTTMQPTVQVGPGPWLRSLTYPSVYVNLNQNATQKPAETVVKVFWDGNPTDLN